MEDCRKKIQNFTEKCFELMTKKLWCSVGIRIKSGSVRIFNAKNGSFQALVVELLGSQLPEFETEPGPS